MAHKTPDIQTQFFSHTPLVKHKLLVVLLQLLPSFSHKQAMSETFFHHNSFSQNSLNYRPFENFQQFAVRLGKHDLLGKCSAFSIEQFHFFINYRFRRRHWLYRLPDFPSSLDNFDCTCAIGVTASTLLIYVKEQASTCGNILFGGIP